ncbi:alpha-(1-_3)-arabinofuranosyltransferase domain-containing protein [Dermatobacter hominis]|uniref:alpha-(1->3)-arabinofuranosyltransferase domain-containing protein n=1 Tax=Dermatobacter hominis TaxID=2884263 RepID=UPI001D1235AA|nr:alpha-(1->3)-arabinofuranosyltransferase family protein [Dermatobacter hominis]UDY36471.1 alpha-(1->3)-arabinofuranosyltransferase [Dermatobacter hominis]
MSAPSTTPIPASPPVEPGTRRSFGDRLRHVPIGAVLLVLVAYVPLLLTKPGRIGADTKTYLYLDPGRLLSRAVSMWDPNIGLGTITHQNIGYLWPMGPYYWLMQTLGVPDWVAQRLWLGSIICAAGLGVRFLLKELHWRSAGITVASFAYALSPYLLDYGARISVILLPFAGLPWLVGLAARSIRTGGWRAPAAFALVTLTVGGVNATSLLLVMVAPVLWMAHATFVAREATLRRTLAAGLRISVLTLVTSFWWIAGLAVQGAYGIPILRYTETYFVVAGAALATELLRGLGYWYFYGRDALGPWIRPAITMVQALPALALSYLLPILAFCGGLLSRFRHRGYFGLLVVAGLVIGVGAHPWTASSPAGAAFKQWTTTDSGLAFRSTPRAVPLIALGLAVLLGAGAAAVGRWKPGLRVPVAGALLLLICLNQLALFRGQMVDENLDRPSDVPSYWQDAAAFLDDGDPAYRVAEVPGVDFATYRWGNTVDPITPGLMDRDYVARELIPYGTPASSNLLNDWDLPVQEGTSDPRTWAPIARLLGVDQIIHRADLQYERFRTPRPRSLDAELRSAPGIGEPTTFGDARPNVADPRLPLDDAIEYGTPASDADPAPVSVFPVEDPRPMLRTEQASAPVLMAGNAAGIVGLAASGGLQADRPLFYSGSFADDPGDMESIAAEPESSLVVTDTNRRQARRWGSVRENDGYTEMAGEAPLVADPADNRLDVFPDADDDAFTVTEQVGGAVARASSYGNPVSYTASGRAARAIDGDPSTAWQVGAFEGVDGEYLQLTFDEPVTTDRITLLQAQKPANRWITGVELSFDDEERAVDDPDAGDPLSSDPVPVELTDASRTPPGQEITFPERTFRTLRIAITRTNLGELARWTGISDVGFAEVSVPGVEPTVEVVRPPEDLLDGLGDGSLDRPLSYVFQRRAADPAEVVIDDEERQMLRWVEGPVARTFLPFGTARISGRIPDQQVDELIGARDAAAGGLTATAGATLAGDLRARASVAVDGDDATAWQTPVNGAVGDWIEVTYPQPVTIDGLPMSIVTDGRHSVPSKVALQVDGVDGPTLDLAAAGVTSGARADGTVDRSGERGTTTTVEVPTGPITGTTFRFRIDEVQEVRSLDWFSGSPTVVPVGIAELGLPTQAQPSADAPLPAECRSDLLTLGDRRVGLRVVGTVGQALGREPLHLQSCAADGDAGPGVAVPAGRTLLETADGRTTGIDVDQLTLASAAGGAAGTDTLEDPPGPGPTPPATTTTRTARTAYEAKVTDADEPYWVVLGQSLSPGWTATAEGSGGTVDLGEPTLVNGFANGWRVDPSEVGADATITMTFAPQRMVWIAIWASLVGVALCVFLAAAPTRWLRRVPVVRRLTGAPLSDDLVGTVDVVGVGPLSTDGPALPVGRSLVVALAVGVVAAVFLGPWVGLAILAVTALALAVGRGQVLLRIACVGGLGLATAYIVVRQARADLLVDFEWMNEFEITHAWALFATGLLAVDPLVELLRRSRAGGPDAPTDESPTETA